MIVTQASPTTTKGNYSQHLSSKLLTPSNLLTNTSQPGTTIGISLPYYASFQHITRPVLTVLFPNLLEFSTPPNAVDSGQTSIPPNPSPLFKEALINSVKTQLSILQQQLFYLTQDTTTEIPVVGTLTLASTALIGITTNAPQIDQLPLRNEQGESRENRNKGQEFNSELGEIGLPSIVN